MSFSSKILYGLLLLLVTGCSSNVPAGGSLPKPELSVNTAILRNRFPGEEKIALLSCIRCGCFVTLLNNMTSADKAAMKDVVFLSDTTCNNINYPSLHITQAAIDSISFDLYNVVLFRKKDQDYKVRIIETEESKNFSRICSEFFR